MPKAMSTAPALSHSARVRGLKQIGIHATEARGQSHSARVRGLKPSRPGTNGDVRDVALRASAWIETRIRRAGLRGGTVALRASAWIETPASRKSLPIARSHSARVRGLKHADTHSRPGCS